MSSYANVQEKSCRLAPGSSPRTGLIGERPEGQFHHELQGRLANRVPFHLRRTRGTSAVAIRNAVFLTEITVIFETAGTLQEPSNGRLGFVYRANDC